MYSAAWPFDVENLEEGSQDYGEFVLLQVTGKLVCRAGSLTRRHSLLDWLLLSLSLIWVLKVGWV
jgi:hypothetical protein